jgi:hypothetical protein
VGFSFTYSTRVVSARAIGRDEDVTARTAVRAINYETVFDSAASKDVRRALLAAGFAETSAYRIARTTMALSGERSVRLSDVLDRAGARRTDVLVALRRHLGMALHPRRATNEVVAPEPRRRGRPRILRCCSGPALTFGSSFDEWKDGACFSADGAHRYALWRRESLTQPTAAFVMLNPAYADHVRDDRTTQNAMRSAAALGLGLEIVNLYLLVAQYPEALVAAGDNRYGDREVNEAHIQRSLRRAKLVVLGFGDLAAELKALRPDVARLRTIIEQERAAGHTIALHALQITASGAPWHPARLSAAPTPIPYPSWPAWLR